MADKMREAFEFIRDAESTENVFQLMSKSAEELGEVATAVNIISGYKKNKLNLSNNELRDNLVEECCDVVQLMLCVASKYGMTYDEFVETLSKKNEAWANAYLNS